jgi:hypothetical protein
MPLTVPATSPTINTKRMSTAAIGVCAGNHV